MTELINLTPHTLNVIVGERRLEIPPSGTIARVSVKSVPAGEVAGIPFVENMYGEVEGLPAPEEGKAYIVSALVGGRVTGRTDVFGPDSGNTALRENGQIVGVVRLVRF